MRNTGMWLLVVALLAGLLALQFFIVPRSALGWFLLFVLGIPIWFVLEWAGERTFGMKPFPSLSRPLRVLVAVPFAIVVFLAAGFLSWAVRWAANQ
jgi:hypothetical protein